MKAILNLWSAFANVAAALNDVATTIRAADARFRESLDYAPPTPQLPHQGEVIDHANNGTSRRKSKVPS